MTIIVTGAAGFIGSHVAGALLARGERVVGIDNLNPYYDPALKEARLKRLRKQPDFTFEFADIGDTAAMAALFERLRDVDRVVHLAAQAGVRYSLTNPQAYVHSNVAGQLSILEGCRRLPSLKHLVYASSSSVYGANDKLPFSVGDPIDRPMSLYGATKVAGEAMAESYSRLFGVPATGLRFFSVYGPWGRPDMAAYIFAKAILEGRTIQVFNNGDMKRDFTYIDDIVAGVIAAIERPPVPHEGAPHRLYNLGNRRSESLMRMIALIETACGRKADIEFAPMQPGDVKETYADIEESSRDLGFKPATAIDEGIPRFVAWFRSYHGL